MKKNKFILLGLTLFSLASSFIVTSCATSDNDPYTITFMHTFGQQVKNSVEKYVSEFVNIVKEEEGISLNVQMDYAGGYDDIQSKVEKTFSTGGQPTIAVAYPDHVANYKAMETGNQKFVVNFEDYINDPEIGLTAEEAYNPGLNGVDDIVPSFYEEGTQYKDEGVYSYPFLKSTEIMLYDYDRAQRIITNMGISTPNGVEDYLNNVSWDDFIKILQYEKEHIKDYYPNATQEVYPLAYDSDANLFITQCYQRNIPYVSQTNGKGSIDFNNDEAKAMVSELKDLYDDGIIITKGTNSGNYTSDLFKQLRCTFVISSTGGTGYNDASSEFAGTTGVAKVPSAAKSSEYQKYVSQGVTLTLLNNTKLSSEANATRLKYGWKLIKYLTSPEVSADLAMESNGYVASRYSSYQVEEYQDYLKETDFMPRAASTVINEINGQYFNYPVFKGTDEARTQVEGIITNVFLGTKDLETAFSDAYTYTCNSL